MDYGLHSIMTYVIKKELMSLMSPLSSLRGYPEITLVVKGGGGVREKLIFTNRGGGRDTAKTNG